jgi:hypothetical protein
VGDGADAEDGVLPDSAFTWTAVFHHDGHTHPVTTVSGVRSFYLDIPSSGHSFTGFTRYEVILTVKDRDGLTHTSSVFMLPDKVNLTLDSVPTGLTLQLDGISVSTPFVIDTLKGFQHTLSAPDQAKTGRQYQFASWSDAGARNHLIVVPDQNTTYLATYADVSPPPATSLVSAWSFNEDGGTTLGDNSGNGHTGTITGAGWTTGKYGQALNFPGNGFVTLGDLDLAGSFTVMAWMQTRSLYTDTCGSLIMKALDYGFELCDGQLSAKIASGANWSATVAEAFTSADLNVWKHVAMTYDGTTLRFYIDGVLINSATGAHTTNNTALLVGRWTPAAEYWNGLIDDVRLYSRALAALEIQLDAATPVGGSP